MLIRWLLNGHITVILKFTLGIIFFIDYSRNHLHHNLLQLVVYLSKNLNQSSIYFMTMHVNVQWKRKVPFHSENQISTLAWNLFRNALLFFDQSQIALEWVLKPQSNRSRFWLDKHTFLNILSAWASVILTVKPPYYCQKQHQHVYIFHTSAT